MNVCLLALCLALGGGRNQPAPDRWIAEDKWKHFAASFVTTALAGGVARAAGADAGVSAAIGAAAGAAAGVWKEIRDERRSPGSGSARDLTWDAVGVGAAAAVLSQAR
jgi:uncharacterized protein YfiM (DUF2279 family)